MFIFERLDILWSRIGHPCETLWPFKFFESFRCSISSVSIYYDPKSDIRVKSYDHLNFSRAFVVQFRASRYITMQNRTSVWKVMTIQISRDVSFFNLGVSIYYSPESDIRVTCYDHLNFSKAFVVQFRASRYITIKDRTSVWIVMTIYISRELSLFNFERLNILWSRIGHLCQKLWPFKFFESFCCSISSGSIYYDAESDIRLKSYDHLKFSRCFILQFRRLDILFAWIGHPCEMLWSFKYLESFRC